ncbi:MAG: type I DNA topoisomerase [Patescibacteria group bacterium]
MPKQKNLVIVESPTKAKTISRFLGGDFSITSSYGHIRDLPKSKMGIDLENNFEPQYVIPIKSRKTVTDLKKLAKNSTNIYFATDEDREGEAIAWHLAEILKSDPDKIKRITFHEITKEAIEEALKNPRGIDSCLVDAQQARRILDRLVGYELSPFLWKKVARGLSAGRVQSVALRMIVEREEEIKAFKPQEFWTLNGLFKKGNEEFITNLYKVDDKIVKKFDIDKEAKATKLVEEIKKQQYQVSEVNTKQSTKSPLPPFTTSTLQQTANRLFGYSAKKTMFLAQKLYEGIELGSEGSAGLITYMRTDSFNLAEKFLNETLAYLSDKHPDIARTEAKRFKSKSKLAQEAHEAIRPTEISRTPEQVKGLLEPQMFKIYDQIWRRAIATQCQDATIDQKTVLINSQDNQFLFKATGQTVTFKGFFEFYKTSNQENILPQLKKDEKVDLKEIKPEQKFTQPPARFSEAGLIKALEEKGIGRPSTYVPTISTIQSRNYVTREDRRLKPEDIGILVNKVLVEHFPEIVDYKFTAHLEDDLDQIAQGKMKWVSTIKEFYTPFKKHLSKKENEVNKKDLTEEKTEEVCDKCGKPMVIKIGRFGKFLACTGYPDCRNTKPLDGEGNKQEEEKTKEVCEKCGGPMAVKRGRYGKFLGCSNYPDCKNIKSIVNSTGIKCPECSEGEIVQRRSKRGRFFYGCGKYPDCKFAVWSKPTGDKCTKCQSLMVAGKGGEPVCSNKECK